MAKTYTSLTEIKQDLKSGDVTVEMLVHNYLSNIRQYSRLNAFNEVFEQEALQQATELDRKMKSGETTGRLAGMVIAIKDNICYKGYSLI
jgi:aspartyl-tRNA(Asn)/glutamyl-tRNA(Gln) amidotransferase subunit A